MTKRQIQISWLQKPTALDLHCLQRQGMSEFSRTRVKLVYRDRNLALEITNQPAQDKTYNKKCDQQRFRSACTSIQYGKVSCSSLFGLQKAHKISEDSDQTARMRRLIWVFAGRTSLIVGFVVRWLKYVFGPITHQWNIDGSNTFGTMENCSSHW